MDFSGFFDGLKDLFTKEGFKKIFDWAWALILDYRYVIAVILSAAIIAFILEKIFELKIVRLLFKIIFLALIIWIVIKFFS